MVYFKETGTVNKRITFQSFYYFFGLKISLALLVNIILFNPQIVQMGTDSSQAVWVVRDEVSWRF